MNGGVALRRSVDEEADTSWFHQGEFFKTVIPFEDLSNDPEAGHSEDAPTNWKELDQVAEIIKDIFNHYSAAFDSNVMTFTFINSHDLDRLLDAAKKDMDVRRGDLRCLKHRPKNQS